MGAPSPETRAPDFRAGGRARAGLPENIVYFARALPRPAFRSGPERCSTRSKR